MRAQFTLTGVTEFRIMKNSGKAGLRLQHYIPLPSDPSYFRITLALVLNVHGLEQLSIYDSSPRGEPNVIFQDSSLTGWTEFGPRSFLSERSDRSGPFVPEDKPHHHWMSMTQPTTMTTINACSDSVLTRVRSY